jgi:hypothetical protein
MKKLRYILLVGLMCLQLTGCDDTYQSSIPNFYVNLRLDLASTYPTFKNNPNHYLVFTKPVYATDGVGFGGILVFCGWDNNYYAFDLACPYEAKQKTIVHPNDIGQAICDSCKTVYDISIGVGNPISGPAKQTLKHYKANLSGDILYITR